VTEGPLNRSLGKFLRGLLSTKVGYNLGRLVSGVEKKVEERGGLLIKTLKAHLGVILAQGKTSDLPTKRKKKKSPHGKVRTGFGENLSVPS